METHTTFERTQGKTIVHDRVFAVAFVMANLFFKQVAAVGVSPTAVFGVSPATVAVRINGINVSNIGWRGRQQRQESKIN